MAHKCFAPRCPTIVGNDLLSCRPHWYGLPRELRNEVWRTAHLPMLDDDRADVLARVVDFYASRGW